MTAMLDDMRRLDAAHARGEITAVELADRKAQLLDAVDDVVDVTPVAPLRTKARAKRPAIGPVLLLCALILTICLGVTLLITDDVMLSATLAITVLAACTVMLFRQLDS